MDKTLRKKSYRYFLPWILISAVLVALFIGLSAQGMVLRMAGPNSMESYTADDLHTGEYLSFDASRVIVAFANYTSKSSDSSTEVLKTYYLLPVGDHQYMAVVDAHEKHADVLSQAMEQSREYYLGDLETLKTLGLLSGTVANLDDGMNSFIVDTIEQYELPGYEEGADTSALICPYQIDLQKTGFLSGTISLVLFVAGLVFLLILLALIIPIQLGVYQKKACAKVRESHSEAEAEALFQNAVAIESVLVGEYIWYQKGASSCVLKTSDQLWGYQLPEPRVVSKYRWPVALYDREQNLTQLFFMEKKQAQSFLNQIASFGYPFVIGYNTNYAQQFKTDLDGFAAIAEQAAKDRKTESSADT